MSPKTESQAEAARESPDLRGRAALSVAEFARAIGVSTFSVHRRIKSGDLRVVRFGRRVLVLASELERLLEEGCR